MKIIRTSTIPGSINNFCKGLLKELTNENYEVIVVSSPGPSLKEINTREGVKTYAVQMERHISPLKDIKSLWNLIKVFHKEKPDLVHSITPKAGLLSMIAARLCRVPVRLHTFTGLIFPTTSGIKQKILILTDKITCLCATHIVPEGNGVKNDLIKFNITKKPLKVLGYGNIKGVDLNYFDPELPEVIEKSKKIKKEKTFDFLFIGRLVKDKGITELISAFTRLNKEFKNTRLILVGGKEEKLDPLQPQTLKEMDSNPNIIEVGYQSDVRPWLLAADSFVFPSYREGFPNVVIEAGAMGLPSIVTNINGSSEIIIEGQNGTIVPAKDVNSLYYAMKKFLSNPNDLENMKQNSRKLVSSRYEQSFVRKCLKEYYNEILSK